MQPFANDLYAADPEARFTAALALDADQRRQVVGFGAKSCADSRHENGPSARLRCPARFWGPRPCPPGALGCGPGSCFANTAVCRLSPAEHWLPTMKHLTLSSLIYDVFGGEPGAKIERVRRNTHMARVDGISAAFVFEWPDNTTPNGRDAVAWALEHFDAQHEDVKIDLWKRFRQFLLDARVLAPAYNTAQLVMAAYRANPDD